MFVSRVRSLGLSPRGGLARRLFEFAQAESLASSDGARESHAFKAVKVEGVRLQPLVSRRAGSSCSPGWIPGFSLSDLKCEPRLLGGASLSEAHLLPTVRFTLTYRRAAFCYT